GPHEADPSIPGELIPYALVRLDPGITPCSLIPGLGVKLSANILAGPTVLSAVGASPPHDGVRRRWWINVASAVSLVESSQKIGRSHQRHRPGRDVSSRNATPLTCYCSSS